MSNRTITFRATATLSDAIKAVKKTFKTNSESEAIRMAIQDAQSRHEIIRLNQDKRRAITSIYNACLSQVEPSKQEILFVFDLAYGSICSDGEASVIAQNEIIVLNAIKNILSSMNVSVAEYEAFCENLPCKESEKLSDCIETAIQKMGNASILPAGYASYLKIINHLPELIINIPSKKVFQAIQPYWSDLIVIAKRGVYLEDKQMFPYELADHSENIKTTSASIGTKPPTTQSQFFSIHADVKNNETSYVITGLSADLFASYNYYDVEKIWKNLGTALLSDNGGMFGNIYIHESNNKEVFICHLYPCGLKDVYIQLNKDKAMDFFNLLSSVIEMKTDNSQLNTIIFTERQRYGFA